MSSLEMQSPRGPDLADYVALLRRRVPVIVGTLAVVVALVGMFSFTSTPVYEGTSELVVQPILSDPFAPSIRLDQQVDPETEQRIITSGAVAERAADILQTTRPANKLLDALVVTVPRSTQALRLTFTDENPEFAAEAAVAFAEAYLSFKSEQARGIIDEQVSALEARLVTLRTELDGITEIVSTEGTSAQAQAAAEARQAVLVQLIASTEAEIANRVSFDTRAGQIIDRGVVPSTPSSPNHARNLLAGLVVGGVLGVIAAFAVDAVDPRVSRAAEVESITGVAVLTVVPPERRGGGTGPQRDAYRRLALVLRSASVTRDVLLVASATDLPARRDTSVNLAKSLARMGASVLLIDADVNAPGLHEVVGAENYTGLVDVVTGKATFEEAAVIVPDSDGVTLLPAGILSGRPTTLLEDHPLTGLLARARSAYDAIIIDAPGVLSRADALSIQRDVDGVLVVARERTTTRPHLEELQVQFDTVSAKMIGAVLHGASRPGLL